MSLWAACCLAFGLASGLDSRPGGAAASPPPNETRFVEGASSGLSESELNIAVGGTQTLSAKGIRNYSEGSPGIIDVKLTSDNAQFVVSGRKAGSTTLLLIRNDGTQESYVVNVFVRSPAVVEQELRQLLASIPTVRVTRIGARTVIDGYVQDEAERDRVDKVVALYRGQAESVVSLGFTAASGPAGARKGSRAILIRIDFYFVELDISSSYAIGIGWPRSLGGAAAGATNLAFDFLTRSTTQAAVTIAQPLPQIDLVEDNGWGKVIRHATVITNNGQEATFQSGGEQNFTVNTGLTVGLQKVNFGLEIGVTPRFDPLRGEVALSVHANVSDLTAPGAGTSVPGRTTTQLTSAVNVKLGQSIVLSGIRSSSEQYRTSGLPLLSRLPVVGILFGSHQGSESESESALYIVPNVMDSVPEESEELIDRAVSRFRQFAGERKDLRFDPNPRVPTRRKP